MWQYWLFDFLKPKCKSKCYVLYFCGRSGTWRPRNVQIPLNHWAVLQGQILPSIVWFCFLKTQNTLLCATDQTQWSSWTCRGRWVLRRCSCTGLGSGPYCGQTRVTVSNLYKLYLFIDTHAEAHPFSIVCMMLFHPSSNLSFDLWDSILL